MPSLTSYNDDDACLMYLVRHGATPHNLKKPPRLQGAAINESLSEQGVEQAGRVAELLSSRPIAAVFASPMRRAMETAAAVGGRHDLAVQPIESLIEVNVGRWEGRSWGEIEAEDPENYARFRADPGKAGYPGGETIVSVIDRVSAALAGLMTDHVGKEIVAVAHSVVNRTYVGSLLGLPPDRGYLVPQENCAVNLIRWKSGRAKVLSMNSVHHLL